MQEKSPCTFSLHNILILQQKTGTLVCLQSKNPSALTCEGVFSFIQYIWRQIGVKPNLNTSQTLILYRFIPSYKASARFDEK